MTAIGPAAPGDAITAAARGLRRAEARAADAATRIAAMGAPVDPGASPDVNAAMAAAPDPGRAMVDLMVARRAYEANAMVLRTADEMQRTLVERLA